MLSELLLHPKTQSVISRYISNPAQSVLFQAPRGFGKETLATYIADQLTNKRKEYQLHIYPIESGIIPIESIRNIKQFVKLRTHTGSTARIIVIHSADSMNDESQNALLKVLEEPPENCFFILTAHSTDFLLPTILSRVNEIQLIQPTRQQCEEYFRNYDSKDITNALAISGGLAGLTASILKGEATRYMETITLAKKALTSKLDEKLVLVDTLSKNRQDALIFIQCLMVIAKSAVHMSISSSKNPLSWHKRIRQIALAEEMIAQNVSTKLVLTRLFTAL